MSRRGAYPIGGALPAPNSTGELTARDWAIATDRQTRGLTLCLVRLPSFRSKPPLCDANWRPSRARITRLPHQGARAKVREGGKTHGCSVRVDDV